MQKIKRESTDYEYRTNGLVPGLIIFTSKFMRSVMYPGIDSGRKGNNREKGRRDTAILVKEQRKREL